MGKYDCLKDFFMGFNIDQNQITLSFRKIEDINKKKFPVMAFLSDKWWLEGKRGKSTQKKWACPVCGLNAKMGIKDNPMIRQDPFEQKTGHPVFFIKPE